MDFLLLKLNGINCGSTRCSFLPFLSLSSPRARYVGNKDKKTKVSSHHLNLSLEKIYNLLFTFFLQFWLRLVKEVHLGSQRQQRPAAASRRLRHLRPTAAAPPRPAAATAVPSSQQQQARRRRREQRERPALQARSQRDGGVVIRGRGPARRRRAHDVRTHA